MKKNRVHQITSIVAAVAVSTVVIVSAGLSQNRGQTRAAFEVVSIRPAGPAPPAPAARVAAAAVPRVAAVRQHR